MDLAADLSVLRNGGGHFARRRSHGGLAVLLCLVTVAAAEQPPEEPVPRHLFSGDRLRIPEFGVSLITPSPAWEWRRIRLGSGTLYVCQNPKSRTYFVVSSAPTPVTGEGYIRGFLRALESPTITQLRYEPSLIPATGAYRVTYEQRHDSGARFYVTTYTVPRVPVSVSLSNSSLASGESPLFTAFVKGLHFQAAQ